MTGILNVLLGNGAFKPVLRIYTSGSSVTETVPPGASSCIVQDWGGGGGGYGDGSNNFNGGAGGYSRTSSNVIGQGGNTFIYTVGPGGSGSGIGGTPAANPGGTSTVTAGTVTGFSTMTANGGAIGTISAAGVGGTASGGNQANITGTTGGAGTAGTVPGDGSPYGGGGGSAVNHGSPGQTGAVVFYYT